MSRLANLRARAAAIIGPLLCKVLGHRPHEIEGTNITGGWAHRAYCARCPARTTWVPGTREDARNELRRMKP